MLVRKEDREAARHRLLADIDQATRETDSSDLDIDEVATEALEIPDLPPPSLTLEDLDAALNHSGILPPGIELRRLDRGSYGLTIPGFDRELRVTTSAEVFDDHFESHNFLSPGGRVFELLALDGHGDLTPSKRGQKGRVWIFKHPETGICNFVVQQSSGAVAVSSLSTLLDVLENTDERHVTEPPEGFQSFESNCLV